MRKSLALVLVFTISLQSEAKTFNRCGLVHELRNQGFPESKLADWVCLVEHESSGRTHITNTNRNGSKDYGLFQINDRYWCSSSGGAGKDCRVACSDLITDDITKAARCAKKVYARHGFKAWYGWKNNCKGSLPDISSC